MKIYVVFDEDIESRGSHFYKNTKAKKAFLTRDAAEKHQKRNYRAGWVAEVSLCGDISVSQLTSDTQWIVATRPKLHNI